MDSNFGRVCTTPLYVAQRHSGVVAAKVSSVSMICTDLLGVQVHLA
jgi:hypothetical protein